jgi:NTP pyrophosphatase (non-canonical NTP hydrolase)
MHPLEWAAMSPEIDKRILDLDRIEDQLERFAIERDWQQFHNPKNLAMALAAESGELLEIFQWLSPEQSFSIRSDEVAVENVAYELADILQYLIRLARQLEIDLPLALSRKLALNEARYSVDKVKGSAARQPHVSGHDNQ